MMYHRWLKANWYKGLALLVGMTLLVVGTSEVYAYITGGTRGGSPASGSGHAIKQPAAVNNGLVAYYRFDGDGTDSVANTKNDLVDNNTVTQATGPGGVGSAAQFTAANSEYLVASSNQTLSTGSNSMTIAAWVYISDKSNHRTIVRKWGDAGYNYNEFGLFYHNIQDRLAFAVTPDGSAPSVVYADSLGIPALNTWYYVVGWYDAANGALRIKVNDGTTDSLSYTSGVYTGTATFNIGRSALVDQYMDGRIARVGYWKRSLSDTERTALYNSGTGLYARQLTGPQKKDLVSYWDLEEASGTRYDTYGAVLHGKNDGTLTNFNFNTTDGYVDGQYGKALKFDGSNDFVNQGSDASLNITGDLTVSFWFKLTSSAVMCVICGYNIGDGSTGYQVWANSASAGKMRFKSGNITADTTFASANDGLWHHFLTSLSGTTASIYIDGKLDSSPTVGVPSTWSGVHTIGAKSDGSSPTSGTLDDVRIYNRALSVDEMYKLFGGSKPPAMDQSLVGYWNMNDALATTTVLDSSGQSHTGTAQRNTELMSTKAIHAGGFSFNGSDYINVGNGASLNITGNLTMSMWLNTSSTLACVVGFYNASDTNTGYSAWVNYSAGKFRFTTGGVGTDSNTSITDGNWHFVAVSLSGTTLNMYIDDALDKSVTVSAPNTFTGNRYIGAKNNGTLPYSGKMDELRVYNRALSTSELNEIYLAGR